MGTAIISNRSAQRKSLTAEEVELLDEKISRWFPSRGAGLRRPAIESLSNPAKGAAFWGACAGTVITTGLRMGLGKAAWRESLFIGATGAFCAALTAGLARSNTNNEILDLVARKGVSSSELELSTDAKLQAQRRMLVAVPPSGYTPEHFDE